MHFASLKWTEIEPNFEYIYSIYKCFVHWQNESMNDDPNWTLAICEMRNGVFLLVTNCKVSRKRGKNVSSKEPMVWIHSIVITEIYIIFTVGPNILQQKNQQQQQQSYYMHNVCCDNVTRGKRQTYYFCIIASMDFQSAHKFSHTYSWIHYM